MVVLCCMFVVQFTLLLNIHQLFINTHCPCRSDVEFYSIYLFIPINDSYG